MEKSEVLVKQLKAIDNEVKLKILRYLVNEGAKSITDISKDLNINFSTAHKYLEGLEKAGLITSNQEIHNRLKRVFYVNSFDISISPTKLSGVKEQKKPTASFKIILNDGCIVLFNEEEFIKKYIEAGLPQKTIENTMEVVYNKVYENITLIELRALFEEILLDRVSLINSSLQTISKIRGYKRNYINLLSITPRVIPPSRFGFGWRVEKHKTGNC